jgi:predicted small metal-binding protein
MTKVLHCSHIGPDDTCEFVAHGETEEEILQQVAAHAASVHNITEVSDELVQAALSNIKDEPSE